MEPRHLLIVEDNGAHARLVKMALSEQNRPITTDWVTDGDDAIDYLLGRGKFVNRQRPDVILLDLRLPTIDGFDVLLEAKSHDSLKNIPVVVLTTSSYEPDMRRAEAAGASAFLVKPILYDEWREMAGQILAKWCA